MKFLKRFAAMTAMLVLSLNTTAVSAQTTDSEEVRALQSQLDQLTERLAKQEKRSAGWAKVLANMPKISGYVQAGYEYNGDAGSYTSTFSIPSVRLSLSGDIGRKFDYKFQFEFADPKLIDAYVRYKICPGFNLQAGQFHTNFSLEGPMSPLDMEAISYAPIVDMVCCKSPDTRDIGIAAYGAAAKRDGYSIFEYSVGVFNGQGKNTLDANKSKDIVTRVKINPLKQLTLSGSFSYGELATAATGYTRNIRCAGGMWWHGEHFFLRTEYLALHQRYAGVTNSTEGCYAVAGYWIKKFCPLVRYNYMYTNFYNKKDALTSGRQSDYLIGLDYKPVKYLRLQANYTRSHYNGLDRSTNIVGVVVTGIF